MEIWQIILISLAVLYTIAVGLSTVVENNVALYKEQGELTISLKWIILNILSFVWHSVIAFVKYIIVIGWSAILICLALIAIFFMALSESSGSIFGDWEPYSFLDGWFDGELFLFEIFGDIFRQVFGFIWTLIRVTGVFIWNMFRVVGMFLWNIIKVVGTILWTILSWCGRVVKRLTWFLFVDPFKWMKKNCGKFFEFGFTIGKKKD